MQDLPVALVTGANQGIGLQIAKDLVAHGFGQGCRMGGDPQLAVGRRGNDRHPQRSTAGTRIKQLIQDDAVLDGAF